MGSYSGYKTPAFVARGKAQAVKLALPVRLRYRLREDRLTGYLDLTFDEETVTKLRRMFGVGEDRAVFLQFRMLTSGLLHVKSDPTGRIGYKLSNDRTVQLSSLQTANIPEPPADAEHLDGVVADLEVQWTPDQTSMTINIPRTLFVAEQRGGSGKKLRRRMKENAS